MKLPINPLLYLVSLGSLLGIVNEVYQQSSDPSQFYDKAKQERIKEDLKRLKQEGEIDLPDVNRWNYSNTAWWEQLANVNFTGKVEKAPEDLVDKQPTDVKPKAETILLNTVLQVICIARGGVDTGIVVKYITDVSVPKGKAVTPSTSVMSTIPAGRRKQANIPKITAPTIGATPPHHINMGDNLWQPYDYIYLKGVSEDAYFVIFELRIEDKKDDGKYPTERIYKNELDLPADVLEKLMAGGPKKNDKNRETDKTLVKPKIPDSVWQDLGRKTVIRNNNVHISERDRSFLENNGQEIFTHDVTMQDYSGGRGKNKFRGVRIRKVSGRVSQFGVKADDVLLKLNGIEIKGMAHAKRTGRRLYKNGARSFRAEILRRGRIVILTYHFKKK